MQFNIPGIAARLVLVSGALGGVALATAAPLIIDTFETGPYTVTLTTPGSMDTAFQSASVLGDTRITRLFVESNPLNRDISLSVGNSFAISDNGTMADSWVRLGYGYRQASNGGVEVDPLNIDLTTHTDFAIDFIANDLLNDVKVYVGTWNGTSLDLSTATVQVAGGTQVATRTLVPLTSFTGTASLADADVIVFEFDNQASGDFALSSVSAVPEPASLLAIALGVSGLLARRKRNKA